MVNGAFNLFAGARDLAVERGDPRLQLRDRERVEILPDQLAQRVGGTGESVVGLHAAKR